MAEGMIASESGKQQTSSVSSVFYSGDLCVHFWTIFGALTSVMVSKLSREMDQHLSLLSGWLDDVTTTVPLPVTLNSSVWLSTNHFWSYFWFYYSNTLSFLRLLSVKSPTYHFSSRPIKNPFWTHN